LLFFNVFIFTFLLLLAYISQVASRLDSTFVNMKHQ
jgi:Na+-transporting methylmalonyl-CoA/oxaloacetate decarboxylase gamma subunit